MLSFMIFPPGIDVVDVTVPVRRRRPCTPVSDCLSSVRAAGAAGCGGRYPHPWADAEVVSRTMSTA